MKLEEIPSQEERIRKAKEIHKKIEKANEAIQLISNAPEFKLDTTANGGTSFYVGDSGSFNKRRVDLDSDGGKTIVRIREAIIATLKMWTEELTVELDGV